MPFGFGSGKKAAKKAAQQREDAFRTAGHEKRILNQRAQKATRRLSNRIEDRLTPFTDPAAASFEELQQGQTAEGLDARLANIFDTDTFSNLVDQRERGALSALSAGGLTRSGTALQELSAVPQDVGLELEQLLTSRAADNTNIGLGAISSLNQGQLSTNQLVADLFRDSGEGLFRSRAQIGGAEAAGTLGAQQAGAAESQSLLNTAVSIGSLFFSDPNLKTDIERIDSYGGLNVYTWNWIEEAQGTLIADCTPIGFMADEVKEKYPQHVFEFSGVDVIDYQFLLSEIAAKEVH